MTLTEIRDLAAISTHQADREAAYAAITVRNTITGERGTLIGISDDGWPIVDVPGGGYAVSWSFSAVEEVTR